MDNIAAIKQERIIMDNITTLQPTTTNAEPPADLPPEPTIEPLNLEEPKVRTKLRTCFNLTALYVHHP